MSQSYEIQGEGVSTWICVLISFALSAYFRVFVVWWYWSAPQETVATITVREFPLNPSFNSLVSLLQIIHNWIRNTIKTTFVTNLTISQILIGYHVILLRLSYFWNIPWGANIIVHRQHVISCVQHLIRTGKDLPSKVLLLIDNSLKLIHKDNEVMSALLIGRAS